MIAIKDAITINCAMVSRCAIASKYVCTMTLSQVSYRDRSQDGDRDQGRDREKLGLYHATQSRIG